MSIQSTTLLYKQYNISFLLFCFILFLWFTAIRFLYHREVIYSTWLLVTRWMFYKKQELITLLEHLGTDYPSRTPRYWLPFTNTSVLITLHEHPCTDYPSLTPRFWLPFTNTAVLITLHEHLGSARFLVGIRVAHPCSFLCYVYIFCICHRSVSYSQCHLCLCIVPSLSSTVYLLNKHQKIPKRG
jgi:hypothetical protein